MKLNEFWSESQLPKPIYQTKPYVVLSKENVVLSAGNFKEVTNLLIEFGNYYADCKVDIRRYDLFMNDNTKIKTYSPNNQEEQK